MRVVVAVMLVRVIDQRGPDSGEGWGGEQAGQDEESKHAGALSRW